MKNKNNSSTIKTLKALLAKQPQGTALWRALTSTGAEVSVCELRATGIRNPSAVVHRLRDSYGLTIFTNTRKKSTGGVSYKYRARAVKI